MKGWVEQLVQQYRQLDDRQLQPAGRQRLVLGKQQQLVGKEQQQAGRQQMLAGMKPFEHKVQGPKEYRQMCIVQPYSIQKRICYSFQCVYLYDLNVCVVCTCVGWIGAWNPELNAVDPENLPRPAQ